MATQQQVLDKEDPVLPQEITIRNVRDSNSHDTKSCPPEVSKTKKLQDSGFFDGVFLHRGTRQILLLGNLI